jgi:hypothetical protein
LDELINAPPGNTGVPYNINAPVVKQGHPIKGTEVFEKMKGYPFQGIPS